MKEKHLAEAQLQELQELQRYFCTDSEKSFKMFRLIGLQLLAITDREKSLEDIRKEAEIILRYFGGLK